MQSINELKDNLTREFDRHRNPEKAAAMKKYLRNQFAFFGIAQPKRKEICKPFLQQISKDESVDPAELIDVLWNMPEREYHYFCIDAVIKIRKRWYPRLIESIEYMIINHSWWDTVDAIASNIVGPFLRDFPGQRDGVIEKWRHSSNMWLNRSALLFQLKYKAETDEALLFSLVKQYADRDEFFIRKAIGWILREYAKTHPDAVLAFVDQVALKPLSRKEALKHF